MKKTTVETFMSGFCVFGLYCGVCVVAVRLCGLCVVCSVWCVVCLVVWCVSGFCAWLVCVNCFSVTVKKKEVRTHHTIDSHSPHLFVFVPTTQEMKSKCAETDPTYSSVSAPARCAP